MLATKPARPNLCAYINIQDEEEYLQSSTKPSISALIVVTGKKDWLTVMVDRYIYIDRPGGALRGWDFFLFWSFHQPSRSFTVTFSLVRFKNKRIKSHGKEWGEGGGVLGEIGSNEVPGAEPSNHMTKKRTEKRWGKKSTHQLSVSHSMIQVDTTLSLSLTLVQSSI